jgi:transcriptional regulator with XRE-family HTH domain
MKHKRVARPPAQSPFQKRIADFRERNNLSYVKLGKRLDCSGVYLYMLETGMSRNPSLRVMTALAKEMECSLDQLMNGD